MLRRIILVACLSCHLIACVSLSKTPLGAAAQEGDVHAVRALLARGSNPCEQQEYGLTPYALAAAQVRIFPAVSIKYRSCNDDVMRVLIESAFDTYAKGGSCPLLLYYAAGGGCDAIVQKLLDRGYNPDERYQDITALGSAAMNDQQESAKILLRHGADPDLAVAGLKRTADKQRPHLGNVSNREFYDKSNRGIDLLNHLKPQYAKPKVVPAPEQGAGALKTYAGHAGTVKSDIDEMPRLKVKADKRSYAIVIGIENYRQRLPRADFASGDAALVAGYLTNLFGFPEENVILLLNEQAAKSDFEKYIEEWLPRNFEKDGTLFFYYSGHGAPNSTTGDAFLVPYDGDPNFIEKTGYPLRKLYEQLGRLQAQEVVVALDSCFSGAGGRSVIAQGSRPLVTNLQAAAPVAGNMVILAASSGNEVSSTYQDKGHGLFTYYLLKGVKGEADLNEDGRIELDELYQYLKPNVQKIARRLYNNEQTPQMITPSSSYKNILLQKRGE